MVIGVAVAGVVALGLLVAVLVQRRRLHEAANLLVDAERRLVLADERAEKAESDTRSADARRTTAEERIGELEGELTDAKAATASAEAARDAAEGRATEAREAGARLIEASAVRADVGGLWFLEALRVERRWRSTLGAPESSPFDDDGEPARLALAAVAEVIREESGTSFDVAWDLDDPVPPGLALALVRAGDELLSALSIGSDGGALRIGPVADGIRLTLEVEPEPELPAELLAVFGVLGWEVGADHGPTRSLTVTVPIGSASSP